jgi:hypothetical protein
MVFSPIVTAVNGTFGAAPYVAIYHRIARFLLAMHAVAISGGKLSAFNGGFDGVSQPNKNFAMLKLTATPPQQSLTVAPY